MSYHYKKIDYTEIKLDTYNPRLPTSLHDKSEETMLEYMLLQADVLSLIEAIGENGFFPGEPIIIIEEKDKDTNYKVLEGNRRLSAVKLIHNPNLAPVLLDRVKETVESIDVEIIKELKKIDCLIATGDEVDKVGKFLGYRHITGTKNWKSLERARYLSGLYTVFKNKKPKSNDTEIHVELAKAIGSKSDYVKRILIGFKVYQEIEKKKFFSVNNGELNDKNFHFVNLADSLNKKNITQFLGIDLKIDDPIENMNLKNIELWTRWLFEKEAGKKTRITGTSAKLGQLDKVLGCDSSKVQFIVYNKTLDEAEEYTIDKEILFKKLINKTTENLEEAEKLIHSIEEYDITIESKLKTILSICNNLNQINKSKEKNEENEFKLD